MFLSDLTNRGATPALIAGLTFIEARHKMIAENVANWQTPGYKTKQLDTGAFEKALRTALDAKGSDPHKTLMLPSTQQFRSEANGRLTVTPTDLPIEHLQFHDGTNGSIEQMMTDLADNAMAYQAVSTLLKGQFDGIQKAIRGAV
ncbi:MAG: flagellar basal body rod protein FlgB [Phycisphaerales bacterium]|nr:flagellar basal body rod protein FlgB [Phycisphaerales bacterium]